MRTYVPYMEYGRTHKHGFTRARQTHERIQKNKAQPAYSSKPFKKGSAIQVWLDQAVSCLKKGPSHMNEYSFKHMDPKEAEAATGKNFNPDSNTQLTRCFIRGCQNPLLVALRPER